MSAYKAWPFAALVIAVLFYLWNSEDEPAPEQSVMQESQPAISAPVVSQPDVYQTPTWVSRGGYPSSGDPYGGYSMGYAMPNGDSQIQFSSPGGYNFRPHNDKYMRGNHFEPTYPPTQPGQDYSRTTPQQTYQDLPGYGMVQQHDSAYRFRPLDKKHQTKRWTGNYAPRGVNPVQPSRPYIYDRYPVPSYPTQLPSEPNPLWANSWPEQ